MTYAQFLLLFLVVPLGMFLIALKGRIRSRHRRACAAVCLLAFIYTSPWDNHAAATKLWTFDAHFAPPGHFIFSLPWEEYAFYFLQGILICLLVVGLSRWRVPRDGEL